MASRPITSWEIDGETGETGETVSDFIFLTILIYELTKERLHMVQ